MRYGILAIAFLVVGCSPAPLDQHQATRNLKEQAAEVGRAMTEEDHAKMADLTLPVLVDHFGGRDGYVKKLGAMSSEMNGKGFHVKRGAFAEPSQLVEASSEVYAVVPYELELSGPGGATGRAPSYLLAVSQDAGAHWKFLDGNGFGANRDVVKQFLPNFPNELELPAVKQANWDAGK